MKPHLNVARQLGTVTRRVDHGERDGRPTCIVTVGRTYDTPIDDVWEALTSAERLPRWFLPVTGELRLGGRYQLDGNAEGEITSCEPPRHLAVTWEYAGSVSWVEVRLAPAPAGGTDLELAHSMHGPDLHWEQYGPGATGVGWEQGLLGLHLHLATGAAADPVAATAGALSEEGRSFVRQSSDGWLRAAVAAGADEAAAGAAAARTAAFYTGEEIGAGPADAESGEPAR